MPHTHSALREGVRLGLIVATTIWLWIASVDAVVGQPFHTFNVLGGNVVVEAMDQGADDYVRKPIDPARFVARVKATLRRAAG